ncbi:STAS domain-containing protein [Streptomyces sp. HUAS TT7]|uniref:STAS domain-containing protein n=1 Tax=Streptomyces sp. HUAS TT7 TaxID=3447507 RepID=UPI003F65ADB3
MPRPAKPSVCHVLAYRTRGHTVIELRGEIDIAAVLHVTPLLDDITVGPALTVVIDLSPVVFMDCSGLGLLCRARRRVEGRGGSLVLVCPHLMIRRILRIAKLTELFDLSHTLEEALISAPQAS